jgi:hypothetical protein
MDWVGREVTVDYISTAKGVTTQKRRYTGRIVTTEWNPITRLLVCQCGDQLQQRVESMTVEDVDTLIPAFWSPDVFDAAEGRSRWDYAQERLGTIQSSLDSSAEGSLRLTTWYAGAEEYVFRAGTRSKPVTDSRGSTSSTKDFTGPIRTHLASAAPKGFACGAKTAPTCRMLQ